MKINIFYSAEDEIMKPEYSEVSPEELINAQYFSDNFYKGNYHHLLTSLYFNSLYCNKFNEELYDLVSGTLYDEIIEREEDGLVENTIEFEFNNIPNVICFFTFHVKFNYIIKLGDITENVHRYKRLNSYEIISYEINCYDKNTQIKITNNCGFDFNTLKKYLICL